MFTTVGVHFVPGAVHVDPEALTPDQLVAQVAFEKAAQTIYEVGRQFHSANPTEAAERAIEQLADRAHQVGLDNPEFIEDMRKMMRDTAERMTRHLTAGLN